MPFAHFAIKELHAQFTLAVGPRREFSAAAEKMRIVDPMTSDLIRFADISNQVLHSEFSGLE